LEKKVDKKIGLPSKGTKQTVEKKQRLTLKENKPIAITKTKINAIDQSNGTILSDLGVITSDVVVPGYKIMRKVAQGGMASVYLAERSEDQLQVILKIINFISVPQPFRTSN